MKVKYKIISDTLEREILDGVYDITGKIPTEEELGKRFEVSRNTVRNAIEYLVKKGCVYQVQGSGVFVRKGKNIHKDKNNENIINLQNMNGVTKDFPSSKIETKVVEFKLVKADKYISDKMKCTVNTPIYFVHRVRYIDDEPYSVEYSYFNKEVILYLNEDIATKSIYSYIRDDLKLTIGMIDRLLYADILLEEDASLLKIKAQSPALVNENIAHLSNGQVFDYSRSILNYKNTKFTFLSNIK